MNIIPCQIERHDQSIEVRLVATSLAVPWNNSESLLPPGWQAASRQFDLGVHPEAIAVAEVEGTSSSDASPAAATALVRRLEFHGPALLATLTLGPHRLVARLPATAPIAERQRVTLMLDLSRAVWFDQATGEALHRR